MSIPHTGRLRAVVAGHACHFNGDVWECADARIQAALNRITRRTPKTHLAIDEVARAVLSAAGFRDQVVIEESVNDQWPGELPEGAVD